MELLLNLIWLALAAAGVVAFVRSRVDNSNREPLPCVPALLALGCMVVLLFPFVSASDDLHPTQDVFEDSSKRIQQTATPAPHAQNAHWSGMLPSTSSMPALLLPSVSYGLQTDAGSFLIAVGERLSIAGRPPPTLS